MSNLAVRTEDLTRDFGHVRAIDHLSMKVPAGRIVAMLGPNGAGKTTLIRLLLGLLEPTDGRAWVLGTDPRDQSPVLCGRVASVSEGHEPPKGATLRTLINLQESASPKFDRSRAEWLYEEQGLPPSRCYGALSKGQRRWALASLALTSGAEVLLLDEPADGLDPAARRKLYDLLREYVTRHEATILVTTHIIGDIERVADDIAVITNGRLAMQASLEDIREHIREVEMPETRTLPQFGEGVRVLGRKLVDTTMLAWVICDSTDDGELRRMADGRAEVRTCTLETVYLAICEHSPDYVNGRKVATCAD
jgi:ABC-2 type transport system ATP-binding protein